MGGYDEGTELSSRMRTSGREGRLGHKSTFAVGCIGGRKRLLCIRKLREPTAAAGSRLLFDTLSVSYPEPQFLSICSPNKSVVQGLFPNVASVRTLKILSYFVALVSCKIEEYKHNLNITQYIYLVANRNSGFPGLIPPNHDLLLCVFSRLQAMSVAHCGLYKRGTSEGDRRQESCFGG
jgi:hypothetical protein